MTTDSKLNEIELNCCWHVGVSSFISELNGKAHQPDEVLKSGAKGIPSIRRLIEFLNSKTFCRKQAEMCRWLKTAKCVVRNKLNCRECAGKILRTLKKFASHFIITTKTRQFSILIVIYSGKNCWFWKLGQRNKHRRLTQIKIIHLCSNYTNNQKNTCLLHFQLAVLQAHTLICIWYSRAGRKLESEKHGINYHGFHRPRRLVENSFLITEQTKNIAIQLKLNEIMSKFSSKRVRTLEETFLVEDEY